MERKQKIHRGPVSLAPHMTAMVYGILGISMVFNFLRRKPTWRHQLTGDIMACFICMLLLQGQAQAREVWAFCFALAYLTWNLLPGSFSSLNLPSHSTFMRNLNMKGKSAECMVCWDKLTLVQLPCEHEVCKRCLQLMGKHCQTACPMCRKPLFGVMDWPVLAAMKSAVVSLTTTLPLCLLDALQEASRRHHRNTGIWMACFYINGFFLWLLVVRQILPRGENWWRLTPGAWRLGHVLVTFVSSIWSIGLMLWLFEGKYR